MDTNSVYLTPTEKEKFALFLDIINVKSDELPVKKRINLAKSGGTLIDDVNLKQIATLLDRNYGSLYNMYLSIIADLQAVLGTKSDDVKTLFAVPSDVYHYYLVERSDVYAFLQILLRGGDVSFKTFLNDHNSSKATVLRHLKQVRDLIRAFGLKISYEPIRLEGDEKTIRLALVALFWLASGGHRWVFPEVNHETALAAFDYVCTEFQLQRPNLLTREMGAYAIAVWYYRIMQDAIIAPDDKMTMLKYPYPNIAGGIMMADFLRDAVKLRARLSKLTPVECRSEAAGLYFMLRCGPAPLRPTTSANVAAEWVEERYIPDIYQFVTTFLERIPLDIRHELTVPKVVYDVFKNELLVTTTTTFILGTDATSVVANQLMDRLSRLKENPVLLKKISDTVDYLLYEPAFSFLEDTRENLIKAYYSLFQQLVQQYHPINRVKVALVIEQDYIEYMDILTALDNIKYVDVSTADAALRDADLVVRTSSIALPADVNPDAMTFIWRINANSDHHARLYGIVHELWIQKATQKEA